MSNFVLAVMGQKGGTGKTTIAYNFYYQIKKILKEDGFSAILIDCDNDQFSSTELSLLRKENNILPELPVINMRAEDLESNIVDLSKKYNVIIIEFGGKISEEMKIAAKIADKIIMPLQASILDALTIKNVEKVILPIIDAEIPAIIIPNRVKTRKQLEQLLDVGKDLDYFKISDSIILDRLCYQNIFNDGQSIFEINPKDRSESEALREFTKLFEEIL